MRFSPVWIAIAKATEEELKLFADDVWGKLTTTPFVGDLGTDDDNGSYTAEELRKFFREFALQHMTETEGV